MNPSEYGSLGAAVVLVVLVPTLVVLLSKINKDGALVMGILLGPFALMALYGIFHILGSTTETVYVISSGSRSVTTRNCPEEVGWFGGKHLEVVDDEGVMHSFPLDCVSVQKLERSKTDESDRGTTVPVGRFIKY